MCKIWCRGRAGTDAPREWGRGGGRLGSTRTGGLSRRRESSRGAGPDRLVAIVSRDRRLRIPLRRGSETETGAAPAGCSQRGHRRGEGGTGKYPCSSGRGAIRAGRIARSVRSPFRADQPNTTPRGSRCGSIPGRLGCEHLDLGRPEPSGPNPAGPLEPFDHGSDPSRLAPAIDECTRSPPGPFRRCGVLPSPSRRRARPVGSGTGPRRSYSGSTRSRTAGASSGVGSRRVRWQASSDRPGDAARRSPHRWTGQVTSSARQSFVRSLAASRSSDIRVARRATAHRVVSIACAR